MKSKTEGLDQLSPFQLKDELIRYARDYTQSKSATHAFLNAGRGNPNWIATTPREAFFLLGQFALSESRRVWDEPDFGGMPRREGIAERLHTFLGRQPAGPGARLLQQSVDYGTSACGFDADAFVHELTDAVIGDNYPEPDRMLLHAERIVHRYLVKTMCDDRPPAGKFDLFAVEGGTAAICYVFTSLVQNGILQRGDMIAIGTPIFTPYIELPRLREFDFTVVEIAQNQLADGRHIWQYGRDEIEKLADPRIKAFFLVNPSNPASFGIDPATQEQIVQLVRTRRPDLIILTDDVYGTFTEGFRSLAAELPRNTILVYSYSKHFGCTGWRLGVIGIHQDNVCDQKLAKLPEADRIALRARYETLTPDPESLRFIDRMVADSRDVALNHTAGLSLPQQAQMTLFSLFALLDDDDAYAKRCRRIVRERLASLGKGLGVDLPDDPLRVGYYVDLDLAAWGRQAFGASFLEYVAAHHQPLDIVLRLAKRFGTVLLNGSGFDGPPWSVRISLANLDAADYEAIGRDLKTVAQGAVDEWRRSTGELDMIRRTPMVAVLTVLTVALSAAIPTGQRPHVTILATGGTIAGAGAANQYGYKAGAFNVDDLIKAVPQLKDLADLSGEQVASIGSQDMNDRVWLDLAARANELLATPGVQGIVVTHGTDTMEETAYFLNLVVKSDKPVVLVGSMRPATAISADGPANLFNAVATAADPSARGRGVLVVLNDEIHAARNVTKTNTTSLQTFVSPNRGPSGLIHTGKIAWFPPPDKRHTTASEFTVTRTTVLPRVDIIYAHSNMQADLIEAALKNGARGLVIAGVGDGNMSQAALDALTRAARTGIVVVRSSRLERGMVLRNNEVDDDKLGFVASGEINAPKSRVLLQLALLGTRDAARVQKFFDDY